MGLMSLAAKAGKALMPVVEGMGPMTKVAAGVSAAGALAGLAGDVAGPVIEGIAETVQGPEKQDRSMAALVAMQRLAKARADREQRVRQKMADNEAALAASNPTLYNDVLAGRKLPRGAVRIGGQPRRDLMERLTRLMVEGHFGGAQEMPHGG